MLVAVVALAASVADSRAQDAAGNEPMTLRFYKRAILLGGGEGAEAQHYLDGTLHGMLLLSDALQANGYSVFCADADKEAAGGLELGKLADGFRAWLNDAPTSRSDMPELQDAPVSMFVLNYLDAQLPCPQQAGGKPGEEDLGTVLKRVVPN